MNKYNNIYDFVINKENEYQQGISINGWEWSMKDHIKTSFYYKHGRLLSGNDDNTPVKNITRPLLNLQYRAEDIDVKDIVLYVDNPSAYHLSFLIKKYHDDVFVVNNDLDTFIDEANESKVDYGAALVKKIKGARPEVIDLQSIAFCDQTDILKGPIAIKHFYNPSELKDMEAKGWGNTANGATVSIDELISLSEEFVEDSNNTGRQNKTPGNYIEIYEVHGTLPVKFLDGSDGNKFEYQIQIIGFYSDKDGKKQGVTLFAKKSTNPFKILVRDKIYSRGLGFGGAEELFEPQVWTNYDVIRIKDMLDAASKTVLKAIGTELKSRYPNGLKDLDNLDIIELAQGEDIGQIDTTPRSMTLFEKSISEWEDHAQRMSSATDPLLGEPAPSGTPFRAQERQVIEGKGIHEYRRGKFAKWLESVYQDWIIPHIINEVTNGTRFLSELTTDEMQFIADTLVDNKANKYIREKILDGEVVTKEEVESLKELTRKDFLKGGNKKFIEILKGEFKNQTVRVKVNVAGKQKDLSAMTDKVVNIWRQILANPQGFQQVMAIPGMAKSFNDILEFSGLSPVYFSGMTNPSTPQPQAQPSPLQPTLQANTQQ